MDISDLVLWLRRDASVMPSDIRVITFPELIVGKCTYELSSWWSTEEISTYTCVPTQW